MLAPCHFLPKIEVYAWLILKKQAKGLSGVTQTKRVK
jgi:hypothetical protein